MFYLFIFILSGLGALLRFAVGAKLNTGGFPWGTFLVNIIGSVALGVFLLFAAKEHYLYSKEFHLALCVGLFGGLTTFSAFSFEIFKMLETQQFLLAGSYILASVLGSVALVFLSYSGLQKLVF